MPCVGLIVLAGSITLIVAPDEQPAQPPAQSAAGFPTVVIDPGHGGNDDGAKSGALVEKELTLDVALRLEKLLTQFKFPTVLTRRDDSYVSLPERAAIANKFPDFFFVSIHFNKGRGGSGVETFFATEKVPPEADWTWTGFFNPPEPAALDRGDSLAGFIQASMVRHTEGADRGIRGRPLSVLRHTRGPAALVECGFLNNPVEGRLIENPSYRDLMARAIAEGVMSYQKSRPRRPGQPPQLANTLQ